MGKKKNREQRASEFASKNAALRSETSWTTEDMRLAMKIGWYNGYIAAIRDARRKAKKGGRKK